MEQYYRLGKRALRRWMLYLVIGATVVSLFALIGIAMDDDDDDGPKEDPTPTTPPAHAIDLEAAESWRAVVNGTTNKPAPFRRAKVPPAPRVESE